MEEQILKEIRGLRKFTEEKFEQVEQRLDKVEQRLDNVEQRLDKVEKKINKVEKNIKDLNKKIENVKREVIQEYHQFIGTVIRVNKEHRENLVKEINEANENLNNYKEKVKHGGELFLEAVS